MDFKYVTYEINSLKLKMARDQYRMNAQKLLGDFLDNLLIYGKDVALIPNTTMTRNPNIARRYQPSTPGRLTTRTGKLFSILKDTLENRWNRKGTSDGWVGQGNMIYKKMGYALQMRIHAEALVGKENYKATIKEDILHLPPRMTRTRIGKSKLPKETKQTLKFRLLWEKRGRPMFKNGVQQNKNKLMVEWIRALRLGKEI